MLVAFPVAMATSGKRLNLADDLRVSARAKPNKAALLHAGAAVTYSELDRWADRIAAGLHKIGIRSGDRVSIAVGNRPEFAALHYGTLRAKAVSVPVNPALPAHDLRPIIVNVHPRAIVAQESASGEVMSAGPHSAPVFVIGSHPTARPFDDIVLDAEPPAGDTTGADLAMIAFTSGTSGPAKGVMLSHANIDSSLSQLLEVPGARLFEDDVVLGAVPLFQIYALAVVLSLSIRQGATVALIDAHETAALFRAIAEDRISVIVGTPRLYEELLRVPSSSGDLSRVRLAVSGGSGLSAETIRRFKERFGIEIWEGYGLAEAASAVTTTRVAQQRPGSIGKALSQQEVRIVDEHGQDVVRGDPGEIWVRGPNVFSGYWENEEANERAFAGDWLRTGDIGYQDEDGYLWLVDREEDVIVVSGFRVFPREVEQVLASHPGVAEAAVVAEADRKQGQRVKAYVVPTGSSPGEKELLVFCTKNLARFKVPSVIEFVEELPRQITGEVMRTALRAGEES